MFINPTLGGIVVASVGFVFGAMTNGASAETVDVAKKCAALVQQAYPPREAGNPAAGSTKGTGQAEQDYYKKCVANGGNVSNDAPKDQK
jgi:hypothetical protein